MAINGEGATADTECIAPIEDEPRKRARMPRAGPRKKLAKAHAPVQLPEENVKQAQDRLLAWFDTSHRVLPWRSIVASQVEQPEEARFKAAETLGENTFAYRVWVSEVMLQQTQVATVLTYFEQWVKKWPTVESLAEATEDEVKAVWSGLGYYRRASYLLAGARYVMENCDGRIPGSAEALAGVPGIGPYTAAAVASIAFGERVAAVDGNVHRVMARLCMVTGTPKEKAFKDGVQAAAEAFLPEARPGDWNQAVMELGATVCRPTNPACEACPLASVCMARAAHEAGTATVTAFPAKAERTKKRDEVEASCVVSVRATSGGGGGARLLLVQRPSTGLLAGTWECPGVQVGAEASGPDRLRCVRSRLLKTPLPSASLESAVVQPVAEVAHVFSHINMTVHVFALDLALGTGDMAALEGALDEGHQLVAKGDLGNVGISTLTRKIIEASATAGMRAYVQ